MALTITQLKSINRTRRRKKIRARIKGTAQKPRLSVYKSNTRVTAQLIDDERGVTLAATAVSGKKGAKKNKTLAAKEAGQALAKAALAKGITVAAFDRGGFRYTGRIAAFAEGVREGGLKV